MSLSFPGSNDEPIMGDIVHSQHSVFCSQYPGSVAYNTTISGSNLLATAQKQKQKLSFVTYLIIFTFITCIKFEERFFHHRTFVCYHT